MGSKSRCVLRSKGKGFISSFHDAMCMYILFIFEIMFRVRQLTPFFLYILFLFFSEQDRGGDEFGEERVLARKEGSLRYLKKLLWLLLLNCILYKRIQFRLFLGCGGGDKTARIASSNTVFSPFCVRAEHSRYLIALISLAMVTP